MGFELLVGVSVAAFFLLILSHLAKDEHPILGIVALTFSILLFWNIPGVSVQSLHVCEPIVSNSTIMSENITAYAYTDHCYVSNDQTNLPFLTVVNTFTWVGILYAIGYVFYLIYHAYDVHRKKRMGG